MRATDTFIPISDRPDEDLQRTYLRLFRKVEREGAGDPGRNILLRGVKTGDGRLRAARRVEIKRSVAVLRRMLRAPRSAPAGTPRPGAAVPPATRAAGGSLAAIAACESGGNPSAVGGGGTYRGKYQFSYETWRSVGGSGDPAAAAEAEQDRRAAMLVARDGTGHWPSCSG